MDMKSRKELIKSYYPGIKVMYEHGYPLKDIAAYFSISLSSVCNAITIMGLPKRVSSTGTKLVYADKDFTLEKLVINGKNYTDITPLFSLG